MAADLILTNATVYTVDSARPWATSVAIKDGRVVALDDDAQEATRVVDLGGAFVMPGLVDVHNHHALAGRAALFELTFGGEAGFDDILAAVRAWASRLGPDEWVVGGAWASTLVDTTSRESARRALDEAAGGRPVALMDDSRHNRWVSTRALELAGITKDTPDPDGGVIVRDQATGELTGVLLEAAGVPVERAVRESGAMTVEQHAAASRHGIGTLHSFGITAFQDAGVSVDILNALKTLDEAGDLHAWVVTSLLVNDPIFGFDPIGRPLMALGAQYRSAHHRPEFIKIFLDGVPPTRTAAFLEPYLPDEAHGACFHGATTMKPDELVGWLRDAAAAGFGAKIHCTGDAAVRATLDAVRTLRGEGFADTRFQVAHGQFVHPDDLARFGELGVAADISPFLWVPGVIPSAIANVLPAERSARMQPNRSLLDSGALVAGGSDWPVSESPNAWEGIQGLVTRQDPTGEFPGALWAEQAITLAEAVEAFTLSGAKAMGVDDVTGSLAVGKSADFIVLDRNPFETDIAEVHQTVVTQTWFAGEQVFQR
ncbi:amidohydrolase [Actinokineospora auranticolor]|uniref:Amidohydrolase 3 domain-containing protein n=1 Tax=Actinokineospora auranticolor TaxID=155976 RepID=A0A2S6GMS1_9PSEU|nr:amidohydrolase [Actinokineospora auranticolor]PPK66539.1 hypothetical protein CLV40_110243 [Actinokineospora auranticolor]